ncbi:uncharacterized protein LOC113123131 [Mastacembelus armatus]|uniref:uncharacterized protein LOC113123131 n=1 Tax=Mastacembelus armatus TaxID=205130 RepID=UPI000E45C7BF|nr:uncharacterized protein LOC113123131 [Mastacembelus armatus]
MKDLSLSLLSRGCGRLVSSNKSTGRQDGRVDVCFTPQDYYIWKSQQSLLRLSNSGRLFAEAASTLPKTYSTRRGPLLLYSQDMVTTETGCGSVAGARKKRVVERDTQQVEQQLSTMKELTAAILNYRHSQYSSSLFAPTYILPDHLPPAPNLQCPASPTICTNQAQLNSESLVQLNPHPTGRNTEQVKIQPQDKGKEDSRTRVRVDLFLQIPRVSRTPSPQNQQWGHYVAMTPEEPAQPQPYSDFSLQQTEITHHRPGGGLHHPNMTGVSDTANDQACSTRDRRIPSDKDNSERKTIRNRRQSIVRLPGAEPETNSTSGLVLPPLKGGQSVCHGLCWEKTDRLRCDGLSGHEHHAQQLPPIADRSTAAPGEVIQAQTHQNTQPQAERVGFQSHEKLNRLHQQSVFPPVLFSVNEETSGKQREGRGKTERQYFKKDTAGPGGAGGGRLLSEKGSVILLEPGQEPPPPVGVLGCAVGWKGPGKQSSLAFLQKRLHDLQDPYESASRGVVRGLLPLELRDFQNGKSVGSLILGPDGEIIQLSLYSNSQDPLQGDGGTQQQALQVVSTEGEELPWVIVLQSDHTTTEGRVELNPDVHVGDIEQHQSIQVETETHMPVADFATEELNCSTEQVLELHRLTETNTTSPSSHTHTEMMSKKKAKSTAKAVKESWKETKKDAKNNVRMPLLEEQEGKEELSGASTEEEEEEELASTGQNDYLYGSYRLAMGEKMQAKDDFFSSQENISPTDATTKDIEDTRRKNTKRKEAAITASKMDMTKVKSPDSDGQKATGMRSERGRERQNTESDVQSIIRHKEEERGDTETAETLDRSAIPYEKKKQKYSKAERRDVKIDEERGDQGGDMIRHDKRDAGRRKKRRGGLKHKDLVVGTPEDPPETGEMGSNQDLKEESYLKSPSGTQNHNNKATREEDTDTEVLSTIDTHSSIHSVSSFRSTATSSQLFPRSSRWSAASSSKGRAGLPSSHGRLSSCSTVMIMEEQLMLNPVKPESSRLMSSEEAAAVRLAQRAERRRQEVERKRREREEEERKQQEREQTEERMKNELDEERRKRAEELRS